MHANQACPRPFAAQATPRLRVHVMPRHLPPPRGSSTVGRTVSPSVLHARIPFGARPAWAKKDLAATMHRQPRPPLFQPPGNGALLALQARDTPASLASVTVSEMDQPSASVRAVGHPVLDRRCVQTSAALGRPSAADCPSKVARPLHAAHLGSLERCTLPSSVFLHHARISRNSHARRTTPFDCLPSPPPPPSPQ